MTNSSINKYARGHGTEGNNVHDNKWTLESLKNNFIGCGFNFDVLWVKIEKIIILTCINLCASCPNYDNCFELMGFDIMVDDKLKPWLLEVNSSPAMSMDGLADSKVKPDLLRDTFRLINFESYEQFNEKEKKRNQLNNSRNYTLKRNANFFDRRNQNYTNQKISHKPILSNSGQTRLQSQRQKYRSNYSSAQPGKDKEQKQDSSHGNILSTRTGSSAIQQNYNSNAQKSRYIQNSTANIYKKNDINNTDIEIKMPQL